VQEDDDGDGDDKASTHGSSPGAPRPDAPLSSSRAYGGQCAVHDGPPPACTALASDPTCLGSSIARRACESFGPLLDPGVGASFVECLRRPAGASACDTGRVVACGLSAIKGACVDGAFRETCSHIAEECADVAPEITGTVCEQLVGSWRPASRDKLIDCLERGCATGGFGICLP
jgi:hypothetical protein